MAENKKWSQKELVNSWTNAARICILDGAPLDNKTLLISDLLSGTGGGSYVHPTFNPLAPSGVITGLTVNGEGHVTAATSSTFKSLLDTELGKPTDATSTYVLSSDTAGVRSWVSMTSGAALTKESIMTALGPDAYEKPLGYPGVNGYVLTSDTQGQRSWAPMSGGSSTIINNTLSYDTNDATQALSAYQGYVLGRKSVTGVNLTTTTMSVVTTAETFSISVPTWNQSTTGNASTATKLSSTRSFALSGAITGTATSDLGSGFTISTSISNNSITLGTHTVGNYLADIAASGNGLSITGTAEEGATRTVASNATAANTPSTIMFRDSSGTYNATNGIHTGAVVAGALNGTLPDDLPIATGAVFGVVKTGTSFNNNAGLININGRHYTSVSSYTDVAVREITAEILLGSGSMTNGTLDQIKLDFAPTSTTKGMTANVIATGSGSGMGLKLSFRKDAGTGRWYLMIYNDSGSAVTRDGILLSIRGQQNI